MQFKNEDMCKNWRGLYRIVQISTGRVYIGQTRDRFIRRYWHHIWKLRNGTHDNAYLQNACNKYGEDDFTFETICICDDQDELDELEMLAIAQAKKSGIGCFNISAGGGGKRGVPCSERMKQIVGEKNRIHMTGRRASEQTRAKMRASSKHIKPSDEVRRQNSERMKNRIVSEETREKIRQQNIGSKSQFAKINEDIAIQIQSDLIAGMLVSDAAIKYSLDYSTVSSIAHKKTWKHVCADGWADFQYIPANKRNHLHDNPVPSRETGRSNDHPSGVAQR